ncbi:hypothetical protein [uncultured Kushneria sp.]|uniref:hypothetical protein n=1 Tax=uncultured Kushneria sp. TaxID=905033 RepID=UPI0026057E29|nr:hypothetical protein [uncultured Kushneria sp.]
MPVYENGRCYVKHEGSGLYRVYRSNMTHAVLRSTIDFPGQPEYALERARSECDRRAVKEKDAF